MMMKSMGFALGVGLAAVLGGCASQRAGNDMQAEVYNAPDTALGSNLPRRGEKRTADTKEVSGEALDALRDSIRPGSPKGLGN